LFELLAFWGVSVGLVLMFIVALDLIEIGPCAVEHRGRLFVALLGLWPIDHVKPGTVSGRRSLQGSSATDADGIKCVQPVMP
jgi:hypothetical protein